MQEHRNALFSSYMIIALASLSFVHLPKLLKPGSWHITLKLFWRSLENVDDLKAALTMAGIL
ncbi:hypothetical protein I7I53_04342 [Histoplasma capsulatum var. duboisii H88]|uniref:Uncharacterized protein n=1 Tax=Ajellomyces capsulatus (strain H88) TaxID=544711 RepID=A0A8A1LUU8_AJEC8|nr:hypothetical protein I7I53_04342 [Histoplasma capsulatum var. duboisii H88]